MMKDGRLTIIIPVCNEEATLSDVLRNCRELNPYEIIVVANGCTDRSVEIAKSFADCKVLVFDKPLGHNAGRAVGAKEALGDLLLFTDADFAIAPALLRRLLDPLVRGDADVALNRLDFIFHKKQRPHPTTVWRQVTNQFWQRPDLNIDSLVSVPHAMTREVVRKIEADSLKNPPLAQYRILRHGFRIANETEVDVISVNRFKPEDHAPPRKGELTPSERRIIGNHIEAMACWLSDVNDRRGQYSDGGRRRDLVEALKRNGPGTMPKMTPGWGMHSAIYGGKQLSVIIPVQNEEETVEAVIREARKIEPLEIIVAVNGSSDRTAELARKNGATVIEHEEALGNDTGRAVGAFFAKGDILLFIDGDFVIPAKDLYPFARAVSEGVDLALNDLDHYLAYRFPLHVVTACKYAVNLACGRKDLGVGSTVAVPHAFSKACIDRIGFDSLASPVVGQVKALLAGFQVKNVHRVEVDKMNLIRPEKHFRREGELLPPSTTRIVGDHIEGISELIRQRGNRGMF